MQESVVVQGQADATRDDVTELMTAMSRDKRALAGNAASPLAKAPSRNQRTVHWLLSETGPGGGG